MRVRMRMVFSLVSSSLLLLLLLLGNHSFGGLHHTGGGGGGVSAFRVNNLVVVLRRPTAAKASWTAAAAATTPTGGVKNGFVVHRGRRTTVALWDTANDDTNVGGNGGGGGRQSGATASNSTGTATSTPEPYLPDYGTTSVEVDRIRLPKVSKRWRRKDLFGSSLVQQTLEGMESDAEFQSTARRYEELGGQVGVTKQERERRRRALDRSGIPPFARVVRDRTGRPMPPRRVPTVLQINVGLYCNQACSHCHVESSPLRTAEQMSAETAARCLQLLKSTPTVTTLDITGGAPELNRHFRMLVRAARDIRGYDGFEIIDRCNLSVLQEPGQDDLVEFLRDHRVRVVASLPCYSAENVNRQRGDGVFERSIAALLALNEAGYGAADGRPDPLVLDLVYNPLGAFLPPEQGKLEQQYKRQLYENFGISFNNLFTITNMPMKRFADFLYQRGELQEYMELLVRNFNPNAVDNLMCLNTVSVDWTGRLYDCDFNQQLGYNIVGGGSTSTSGGGGGGITVFDLDDLGPDFVAKYSRIRTDNHCFGCTAGMGSS